MAPLPPVDARELEACFPTAHDEKLRLSRSYTSDDDTFEVPAESSRKMRSPRRILLAISALILVAFTIVSAVPAGDGPCHDRHTGSEKSGLRAQDGSSADTSFPCLLGGVSGKALHEVLHKYFPTRFKDGIYPSDKIAMEAVHREDPTLASSLVEIAKRQVGTNSTIVVSTPTIISTVLTTPTVVETTTPITATSVVAETTPTSVTPATSTPPTSTPPTTATGASTTLATSTTPSSTAGPTHTTAATTSSARTQRSATTMTSTLTSTAADGGVVVITQTTVVDPESTPTSTSANGSLQTNAAVAKGSNVAVEALAGVVLVGLILV